MENFTKTLGRKAAQIGIVVGSSLASCGIGALVGGAIGSVIPGIGTAVGAAIGGAAGVAIGGSGGKIIADGVNKSLEKSQQKADNVPIEKPIDERLISSRSAIDESSISSRSKISDMPAEPKKKISQSNLNNPSAFFTAKNRKLKPTDLDKTPINAKHVHRMQLGH